MEPYLLSKTKRRLKISGRYVETSAGHPIEVATKTQKPETKTLKKVIFSIKKLNISIEKVIIFIEKPDISIEKTNIFIKKLNISIEKANIFIKKLNISIEKIIFLTKKRQKNGKYGDPIFEKYLLICRLKTIRFGDSQKKA